MPSSLLAPAKHLAVSMLSKTRGPSPEFGWHHFDMTFCRFTLRTDCLQLLSHSSRFPLIKPQLRISKKSSCCFLIGGKKTSKIYWTHIAECLRRWRHLQARAWFEKTSIFSNPANTGQMRRSSSHLPPQLPGSGTPAVENKQQIGDAIRMIVEGRHWQLQQQWMPWRQYDGKCCRHSGKRQFSGDVWKPPEADCIPKESSSTSSVGHQMGWLL